MTAAKKRGKHVGRPPALDAAQLAHAKALREQGSSYADIAALFRIDRKTVSRLLNAQAG